MRTELTRQQKITALLALLDGVIKKDEERTRGEWKCHLRGNYWTSIEIPDQAPLGESRGANSTPTCSDSDASFIASASVSHGLNARADKMQLEWLLDDIATYPHAEVLKARLSSILSLYPDSLLQRYLP